MPTTFQLSDSYSIVLVLTDNNIFLVHCHIRLTKYVGKAILLRHPLVRYIPHDGPLMRKAVLAESGDNKRIGQERHTCRPDRTLRLIIPRFLYTLRSYPMASRRIGTDGTKQLVVAQKSFHRGDRCIMSPSHPPNQKHILHQNDSETPDIPP